MTDTNRSIYRRTVLGSVGGMTLFSLAGCASTEDDTDDGDGDEVDATQEDEEETADNDASHDLPARGVVYGFTDDSIVAIDPASHDIVEIERVSNVTWGDIFVGPDHLFAVDSRIDQVHVVDLDTATVTSTVDVSGGPVHGFYDEATDRAYVHADDEATLYGIDGANPTSVEATIELTASGHGKPIRSGDGRVFVTNVSDGGVFSVDLDGESVEHFSLNGHEHSHHSDEGLDGTVRRLHGDGGGTHFIQYASESELIFVEQMGGGHEHSHDREGDIEFLHDDHDDDHDHDDDDHDHDDDDHDHGDGETVIVDATTGEIVGRLSISGPLYISDDDELLAVIDGDDVHLVDATTRDADVLASISVGGSPGVVRFTDEYVLTVNHSSGDVSFIDRSDFEEVARLGISERLEDQGPIGDGRLVTVHDETVTAIDLGEQESEFVVEVPGLRIAQYVPEDAMIVKDGRY